MVLAMMQVPGGSEGWKEFVEGLRGKSRFGPGEPIPIWLAVRCTLRWCVPGTIGWKGPKCVAIAPGEALVKERDSLRNIVLGPAVTQGARCLCRQGSSVVAEQGMTAERPGTME